VIINLTPHTVNLKLASGTIQNIERKGRIPRIEEIIEYQDTSDDGAVIYGMSYGGVIDAPPIIQGTYYIVSRMVAEAMRGRNDLLFPIMLERDSDGKVVSATALARVVPNLFIPKG